MSEIASIQKQPHGDSEARDDVAFGRAVTRKVSLRLIPFLFILYIAAYLDRINVSFAAETMQIDIGLSEEIYGYGAGIFFIGYFLFEVPSNIILERTGARRWIARIMITWGIISSAMMFVKGPVGFYVMRFLLGVAEAGFFPGMILYLTYWYPSSQRAKAVAWFMTATAIAGVIGAPVSGLILKMHGMGGLAGWQWLFLLEGIPSVLLGLSVLFYLTDGPAQANWLTENEKRWLVDSLSHDKKARSHHDSHSLMDALQNSRVWLLSALYFSIVINTYAVTFFIPKMVKERLDLVYADLQQSSIDAELMRFLIEWRSFVLGCVVAIPYLFSVVAMILNGTHSDRTGERRWHIAIPCILGAIGLAVMAYATNPFLSLAALTLGAMGIWATKGPFWALPTAFLKGTAAAGGIALINSIGNLGGQAGPSIVGKIKQETGGFKYAFLSLTLALTIAAILAVCVRVPKVVPSPAPEFVDEPQE